MSTFKTNGNALLIDDDALALIDGGISILPFAPGPELPLDPTGIPIGIEHVITSLPLGPGIALPPTSGGSGFSPGIVNLPLGPGIALPPSGSTGF